MAAARYVTVQQITLARRLRSEGMAHRDIAVMVGVHASTISRMLAGETGGALAIRAARQAAHRKRVAAAISKAHTGPRAVDCIEYARQNNTVAKLIRSRRQPCQTSSRT